MGARWLILVCACACGKSGSTSAPPPARFEGPMPVRYGDCAAPSVTFVSGPRPLALDEAKTGDPQSAIEQARQAGVSSASDSFDGSSGTLAGAGDKAGSATTSIASPSVNGDLDKAIIRRYIKRELDKIQYCYEKQLLATPGLTGTVTVQFFITPEGLVSSANGTGMHPEVASCVAGVIHAMEFPKPKGGGVQVSYPFTFRPAPSAAATTSPPPPPAAPPPPPPPATPDASGGTHNPLDQASAPIVECLRSSAHHWGALAVDLTYGANGAVESAKVLGSDDARLGSCIGDAAKTVHRLGPAVAAQRCAFAFGVAPAGETPGVDITDQIVFDGKPIARTEEARAGADPVLSALSQAVESRRDASKAQPISVRGPIVVRPAGATPMKVVDRVLRSVMQAGEDLVLGVHRGTGWDTLPHLELPIAPVAVGRGGRWSPVKAYPAPSPGGPSADEDRVRLSLLVTTKQVWVGVSRVDEFQAIEAGPTQHDKLAAALREHKESAFFADRTDIDIAGEDDVPYADVVAAIEAATAAGFTDWKLAAPSGLAARPTL